MDITEIFYSLQGEGTWTGLPNIFIRTSGCNLRCSYCDTPYAYEKGTEMTINDILDRIKIYPCTYVCLTGGEPLLQRETIDLLRALVRKKYVICVETNGSLPIDPLVHKKSVMVSLDVKCPSSRMHKRMRFENISLLSTGDQVKFVMKNKVDYEFAKKILAEYRPCCTVFFQPVWGTNPGTIARWILNDGLPVKLGVQLHKMIFGDRRGV